MPPTDETTAPETPRDRRLPPGEQERWLLEQLQPRPPPRAVGDSLVSLSSLHTLDLPGLGLESLPPGLPAICPSLSVLFCPGNNFAEVPAVVGECPNLQMVSFRDNGPNLGSIHPGALRPQLRWLILTGNNIREIPDTIGRCHKLRKLMLSGNRLEGLPSRGVLENLTGLELVRLACNKLARKETAVDLLGSCPNLKWVALAGNPFLDDVVRGDNDDDNNGDDNGDDNGEEEQRQQQQRQRQQRLLPILDDPILEDESWPVLGRGAGGVTRKATWKGREVAVKTFAGELTSDGSPRDEKAVSKMLVLAGGGDDDDKNSGGDPALIELLGETRETGALVMEFLENYGAVAGPPSMESCSRDVYNEPSLEALGRFPLWKIVVDTLRVLAKLHSRGITHADFYAHNLLIRPPREASGGDGASVKVSDFGAAYRYRRHGTTNDGDEFGGLVETVELRAFAVLVRELFGVAANARDGGADHPWEELLAGCEAPPGGTTFRELARRYPSRDR